MTVWLWVGFIVLVLGMLALDLGVFHRRPHVIGTREALAWTAFWVIIALLFNSAVYYMYEHHWLGIGLHIGHQLGGRQAALEFFSGYLIEKSLSLDNIFVIAMIFAYFRVPAVYQHRVLFWGILGALIMRGVMIAAGVALIRRFDWITYVFGAILFLTAVKMLLTSEESVEPENNILVRVARRWYPVSPNFEGQRFFTRIDGRAAVTPLFLVLLVVESTDVLFAVDSIPAIFAVTRDPFIVFTSNVFAILGLRSLYFALASLMDRFRYLKLSLVFVLAFVGVKMILAHAFPDALSIEASLIVICSILAVGMLASVLAARRMGRLGLRAGPAESDTAATSTVSGSPDAKSRENPRTPAPRGEITGQAS
ncbi:MAG: TerC family protein [Phycisphaerae bacterium]|nr:TerC family protein [Phycisphaerae bacterium]NUQ45607.1 TerC family protein [Phycisphaerae bacterium]